MSMFNNYLNMMFQGPLFYVLIIWTLVWKGLALWRAAKNDSIKSGQHHGWWTTSKVWYIVLLVVNTMGILEILYFFIFGKKKTEVKPTTPVTPVQ